MRWHLSTSASRIPVGRVRPSVNVVQDGLFELEAGEHIQVALLDQEKEWGGDEEGGGRRRVEGKEHRNRNRKGLMTAGQVRKMRQVQLQLRLSQKERSGSLRR
jgi:hypothetical protein